MTAAARVLETLTAEEGSALLADLLAERPELVDRAAELAAARLEAVDVAAIEEEVVDAFQALPFTAIAHRAGRQRGRGYVDEHEAASEVLQETLAPHLEPIGRLARGGFADAAVETGLAVLAGLYRLRHEAGPESLFGWVGAEDEAEGLATSVVMAFDAAGLRPPRATVDERFEDWAGIARAQRR